VTQSISLILLVVLSLGCANIPFTKADCVDVITALAILERQIVKHVEDDKDKLLMIAQWDSLAESGLKMGCVIAPLPTS